AVRLRDRRLFKTVRLPEDDAAGVALQRSAEDIARGLGFDPRYYVATIDNSDKHRQPSEQPPLVLLDSAEIVPVTAIEPMIAQIMTRSRPNRVWLAVPKSVKEKLGRFR